MITIRRISPDQAELLRVVRLAALADAPSAFGSTLEGEIAFNDDVWNLRARLGSSGDEGSTFLAWHDNGRIVGIAGGHRSEPSDATVVDLVSMWTDPSVRRTGTGRLLVQTVIDWATTTGAEQVELWVTRGNDPAQRLYEAMGFVVTGDHQPLPSDPCKEEIRMVRVLTIPPPD